MRAVDVRDYLNFLINKADDQEKLEINVNGLDINKIEYIKGYDSCDINDEVIQITAN